MITPPTNKAFFFNDGYLKSANIKENWQNSPQLLQDQIYFRLNGNLMHITINSSILTPI